MCRRCASVGIQTRPERIQAMVAGGPVADAEFTDVNFALIVTQINREKRAAKFRGVRRRGTHSLIFAGLVLIVLNFLFCIAYVLLNLTEQTPAL